MTERFNLKQSHLGFDAYPKLKSEHLIGKQILCIGPMDLIQQINYLVIENKIWLDMMHDYYSYNNEPLSAYMKREGNLALIVQPELNNKWVKIIDEVHDAGIPVVLISYRSRGAVIFFPYFQNKGISVISRDSIRNKRDLHTFMANVSNALDAACAKS